MESFVIEMLAILEILKVFWVKDTGKDIYGTEFIEGDQFKSTLGDMSE